VVTDTALLESEARLHLDGAELASVEAAVGSPQNPMTPDRLAAKVAVLAGDRLEGALDDPGRPAAELASAAGLG
jgi:hypothetical protein